ncbi:thymidine kinase [Pelomyxa schiedti]|nr:thymidine kinase [Pelomyxa schiedti]
MFSGKTTELLRRIKRYTVAKKTCVVIKYYNDTRYDAQPNNNARQHQPRCATHDHQQWDAVDCVTLSEVEESASTFDVIGIDEGQFFLDVVPFCEKMANKGKVVVVAALDGTFQRKPFGSILQLVPLAESVTKLTAVCMCCYKDAAFSRRLGSETEIEVIGGADNALTTTPTTATPSSSAATAATTSATTTSTQSANAPTTPLKSHLASPKRQTQLPASYLS